MVESWRVSPLLLRDASNGINLHSLNQYNRSFGSLLPFELRVVNDWTGRQPGIVGGEFIPLAHLESL